MKKYKVAVVGATGNVGREMLKILAESNFPVSEVVALASQSSVNRELSYGDHKILKVQSLSDYDFQGTDIALFSAGSDVSKRFGLKAAKAGTIVIDNSSYFRMDPDVPLVIPEVNPEALNNLKPFNIIANPNCSTIQMLVALNPLHQKAGLKRIIVSTYQSVSGAGKEAMDELYKQTKSTFMFPKMGPKFFTKQIAFNVIPHIDDFLDNGSTKEEEKIMLETQKILGKNIKVTATCVRVPVFVGHSEAIHAEFEKKITVKEAYELLEEAPSVAIMDRPEDNIYATPIEVVQEDGVYISRLREDLTIPNGLIMWVVADNVRKGAALNAVQIAQLLIDKNII